MIVLGKNQKEAKMPKYIVNPNTKTIHIKGNCWHVKSNCPYWNEFDTEENANTEFNGNLKHCVICWRKRDED